MTCCAELILPMPSGMPCPHSRARDASMAFIPPSVVQRMPAQTLGDPWCHSERQSMLQVGEHERILPGFWVRLI